MSCAHLNFRAQVNVTRMTEDERPASPVRGFMCDITVNCAECGLPFQFLGLEPGLDTQGARVSIDGLEAHIALSPQGARPSPLQRIAFNVGKFDG